jgi:hypothetical protein
MNRTGEAASIHRTSTGLVRGIGIDQAWFLAVLVVLVVTVSILPIPPNDLWWHLKFGELIYTTRTVPAYNLFAWTLPPGQPFFYGAWLGELLFYLLHRLGSLELAIAARTVITVLVFWLVGWEARRRSGSWRVAAIVTFIAAGISASNTLVRPQVWAWLPFTGFYLVLSAYSRGCLRPRCLLLLPLLMAFWVNVHGSFILGFVLVAIFFAGQGLGLLIDRRLRQGWPALAWLAGSGLLSALAMLANPRGLEIVSYVHNMMTDPPSQTLVAEWQSPAPTDLPTTFFFASILLLIGLLAYSRYRPRPTEALLIAAFLWLAWSGVRYMIWYALVSAPILAAIIAELARGQPWVRPAPKRPFNLLFGAVLCLPVLLVHPAVLPRLPLPEGSWEHVLLSSPAGPMLSTGTPVAAAEYLKHNPGGALFNEMGYGSYLIWAVPEQGVFIDPRVELYPYEMWLDYIRISRASRYNELLEKYRVDRLLLHKGEQSELIAALATDPVWALEYEDDYSQIWYKVRGTDSVSPVP